MAGLEGFLHYFVATIHAYDGYLDIELQPISFLNYIGQNMVTSWQFRMTSAVRPEFAIEQ